MMKLSLWLSALALSGTALAQPATLVTAYGNDPQAALTLQHLLTRQYGTGGAQQKGTGTAYRLIATADYGQGMNDLDSSYFHYSGSRGSRPYSPGPNEYQHPAIQLEQEGLLRMACDYSISGTRHFTTNPFVPYGTLVNRFDGNDRDTSNTYSRKGIGLTYRITWSYNASGLAEQANRYDSVAGGGGFMLHAMTFMRYNAQQQLIYDSTYYATTGQPDSKTEYTYNAAGKLTQLLGYTWNNGSWQPQNRFTYTYTAGNLLRNYLFESYQNNQWKAAYKDSFAYQPGSARPVYHDEYHSPAGTWQLLNAWRYHIGANGKYDTMYAGGWNTSTQSLEWFTPRYYLYDGNDNLIFAYQPSYFFMGNFQPERTSYYYWEPYTAAGVNVLTAVAPIRCFPNPVIGATPLQVDLSVLKAGTPVRIQLLNAAGQVVLEQTGTGGGMAQITLSEMVPGMYLVQVQDNAGKVLAGRVEKR